MLPDFHRDIPTPPPMPPEVFEDVPELEEDEFVLESEGNEAQAVQEMLGFAKGQIYDFRVQGRDGVIRAAEAIGVAPSIEIFEDLEALNVEAAQAAKELEAELQSESSEIFDDFENKMMKSLEGKGIDIKVAEKMVIDYRKYAEDKNFVQALSDTCEKYGLDYSTLSEESKKVIGILSIGVNKKEFTDEELKTLLQESFQEVLVIQSIKKIDSLSRDIIPDKEGEIDEQELAAKLKELLKSLESVSKQLPAEEEKNRDAWDILLARFQKLVDKKRNGSEKFQKVFADIFNQFNDFIEDDIFTQESLRRMKEGKAVMLEELMQELYGRTKKEMEELKVHNREQVAEEILRLKDEPVLTIEMIEKLHAVNNRGIVPKNISRVRADDNMNMITFGKRVGIIGLDVRTEVEDVLARANKVRDKKIPKVMYEIAAAQLHNDLLDIHAFDDRNGSTAVLFMELLMAKRGYKPSPKRSKDYYSVVQKVLGYNPVAVGIVAYEHYKIAYQEGHYEGKTTQTPEMKSLYNEALELHAKAKKLAKKAEKKES